MRWVKLVFHGFRLIQFLLFSLLVAGGMLREPNPISVLSANDGLNYGQANGNEQRGGMPAVDFAMPIGEGKPTAAFQVTGWNVGKGGHVRTDLQVTIIQSDRTFVRKNKGIGWRWPDNVTAFEILQKTGRLERKI